MVKSSKGFRSRSRGVLTKEVRRRGLRPVTQYLKEFPIGARVSVRLEASDPHGMPHPRYQGRTCIVIGRVGRAYRLEILDGHKRKVLIANPIHIVGIADHPAPEAADHA